MITSFAVEAAKTEWLWMRWAVALIASVVYVLGVGDDFESRVAPVLRNISIDNVRLTGDGRLCFVEHVDKARAARGVFYVAQVYYGDDPNPDIRGIEHADGTPFGGPFSDAPVGHYDPDTCVRVKPGAETYYRLGVRIHTVYHVPNRPWNLTQPELWIDYYKENPAEH